MINATPAKLRSGAWGARVPSTSVRSGDQVQITSKAGKSWPAKVVRVVWSGDGVSLCETASLDRAPSTPRGSGQRRRRGGTYECEECGDYVEPGTSCWETGMIH